MHQAISSVVIVGFVAGIIVGGGAIYGLTTITNSQRVSTSVSSNTITTSQTQVVVSAAKCSLAGNICTATISNTGNQDIDLVAGYGCADILINNTLDATATQCTPSGQIPKVADPNAVPAGGSLQVSLKVNFCTTGFKCDITAGAQLTGSIYLANSQLTGSAYVASLVKVRFFTTLQA